MRLRLNTDGPKFSAVLGVIASLCGCVVSAVSTYIGGLTVRETGLRAQQRRATNYGMYLNLTYGTHRFVW